MFYRVVGAIFLFLLLLAILFLVLVLTVFKPRTPRIDVLSATLDGISPFITLPVMRIELNVSLPQPPYPHLQHEPCMLLSGMGFREAVLFYRGMRIGEAELSPGEIRGMGSSEHRGQLTIQMG